LLLHPELAEDAMLTSTGRAGNLCIYIDGTHLVTAQMFTNDAP
jgi:hypothetical protein